VHIGMIAYTNYRRDSRVRREAEALAACGDTVDFLCLKENDGSRDGILSGVRLVYLNISQYRGDSTLRYMLSYLTFFLLATFRIALEHAKNRYEIVHVHTMPDFLVFSAIIPKLFGAKVILDVHDLMPELYASKFGAGRASRAVKFLTFVERCSIAFAHGAIAVQKPHLDALVSHGNPPEKFLTLLNTPDERIFTRQAPAAPRRDGHFRMIFHGTISPRQGLEVAVRAVAIVRRKIPHLSFDILGDGDGLAQLMRLTHELSLDDVVRFSGGYLPVDRLCGEIRSADLGLVPILNDSFTRYILPVKLLEYVFLGIPSITSRTPTIESYFDPSMVRYVEPGNVESLADAMYDLYSHPEKRRSLAENANRFNERFSWEKQRMQFSHFVEKVAGNLNGKSRRECRPVEGENN
jgi:glycosyltransferase involved in cell wall biosynthesis